MVLMKDKMNCLIVTDDKEFKNQAISYFISAGFPGQKKLLESVDEIQEEVDKDVTMKNIVVKLDGLLEDEGASLAEFYTKVGHLMKDDSINILVYVNGAQLQHKPTSLDKVNCFFTDLEISKKHFNDLFNRKSKTFESNQRRSTGVKIDRNSELERQKKEEAKKATVLTAAESSKHLLEAIQSMNKLMEAPGDMKALKHIGQRFNGLFGTFSFYGDATGWLQLNRLGMSVDYLTRSYLADENLDKLTDQHLDILSKLLKTSFQILQTLREKGEYQNL